MFPRERRLTKHRDIELLMKTGRRVSTAALILRYLPKQQSGYRATVVVSTAVSKKATIRNRLKRQVRHILKDILAGSRTNVDIMLSAKPSVLSLGRAERVSMVYYLLARANIITKRP